METIIIAIGAVVVIGIVAFFVLKKLQAQKTELPASPQAHIPTQQTPVAPTPTATGNDLAIAEAHIRNQNYNEAIAELKRVLMTNPRHNDAMLKLLQTYGVTKQFAAFNQLHQKIHEIADGETIREADFCKSLLEDEINSGAGQAPTPQPTPAQTAAVVAPVAAVAVATQNQTSDAFDNGLDFDFETPASKPTPSVTTNTDTSLDFDLETLDAPAPTAEPTLSGSDFDLDFDTPVQPPQPTAEPTLDFDDFSFDEPAKEVVAPALSNEPTLDFDTTSDDLMSLDGSLESDLDVQFGLDPAPAPTAVDNQANDALDGFDFEFETPEPTPAVSEQPNLDLDFGTISSNKVNELAIEDTLGGLGNDLGGDLDFNFEATPEPIPTPATPDTAPSDDLALDGFDFDTDVSIATQKPVSTPQAEIKPETELSEFGDFDLTFSTETPSAPVVDTTPTANLDFGDFDTKLTAEPATKPAPIPTIDPSDEFADFDLGFNETTSAPVVTPTVTPTSSADDDLGFGDLDLGVESTPAVSESVQDDGLAFDTTDLAFDTTPVTDIPNDSLDIDGFDFTETPATITPEPTPASVSEPVTSVTPVTAVPTQTAGIPSELGFVDELDNTGITLNLAKQYLDLGEYDSAKRLLDEVIQTGNATQQQNARELLTQLV
ncbi:Tfp pilus assembly protein FimV [Moraxella caprae]|uniref:Tfp pilus assembly protein FimV n=1 Tax=Moraxella caprae TaxID=90240 RepID=A0A378R0Q4_9GAMM|nr:FimV/HubP family polar landmark protein [Moraxella caprae]STZ08784.1 Tfp pilus assembly protein FimV [Moraxella caprae]